ncbi:phage holin family protein [Nocardioides sp. zg-DK7169]|uniref:phage holin family protein n=1 Tax=Nocardioides sp. zg-DK7169 TaxID=2736600 RepID=UPI001558315C|nr:phage holin family protein [Nocardioides sp. zg-DK7169]NPC97128.1 phage holin family protein [Nocardioides sp. zg-DK7169]
MTRFLTWLVTNVLAVAAAAWLINGISFAGPTSGRAELEDKLLPVIGVALILGVITSFVKPVLQLLSFPLIILTLGIFLLVINAALLMLTGWVAHHFDLGFEVDGFWPAVGGAIVITVVTWIVDGLIGVDD